MIYICLAPEDQNAVQRRIPHDFSDGINASGNYEVKHYISLPSYLLFDAAPTIQTRHIFYVYNAWASPLN